MSDPGGAVYIEGHGWCWFPAEQRGKELRMTHPAERRLSRIAADVCWLEERLPKTLAALAAVTPDGWPDGSDGGGGDVARPTEAATLAGLRPRERYAEIDALTAEAAGIIGELVNAVERVADPGVDTDLEWRRHRCSGGEGEWADPTCTRIAVRTERFESGVRAPVCWACRKRMQRWRVHQRAEENA